MTHKIKYNSIDKVIEGAGVLLLLVAVAAVTINFLNMPDEMPRHFDLEGNPDAYGTKWYIWMIPLIGAILYIGISWLSLYPHKFNYPVHLNRSNRHLQFRNAVRMMLVIKFAVALEFTLLTIDTIRVANGEAESINMWSFPLFLALIFGSVLFFFIRAKKLR